MRKTAEIVITAAILGVLYFSSPVFRPTQQHRNSVVSNSTAGEVLLIADGTDPMPGKKR